MAVKKKSVPKAIKRRPAPRKRVASPAPPVPAAPPEPVSRPGIPWWGFAVAVCAVMAAFFLLRKQPAPLEVGQPAPAEAAKPAPEVTPPSRKALDAPVEAPAPKAALPTQKRATSPGGVQVWNRAKAPFPALFRVLVDKRGVAEARVFRAGNKTVRLIRVENSKGTVSLTWDGKDEQGKTVPAGTYFVRLSGAHGDMVEEILVK